MSKEIVFVIVVVVGVARPPRVDSPPEQGVPCGPVQTPTDTESADSHEDRTPSTSGPFDESWDVTGPTAVGSLATPGFRCHGSLLFVIKSQFGSTPARVPFLSGRIAAEKDL